MSNNFANLMRRARLTAIVISAVAGIFLGAASAGAVILVMKLVGGDLRMLALTVGCATVLVSSGILLLILMPTERRLAKRLDTEHSLRERVSTMIEFKTSDDPFTALQREDANEKLGEIRFSPWRKKQVITVLVTCFVSAALLTTALVIPAKTEYIEPEQPLTEFDKQWILTELSDMISTVETSLIADTLKTGNLRELRALYTFVEEHEFLSEMKVEAIKAVIAISGHLTRENSAIPIGEQLSKAKTAVLKELGAELSRLGGTGVQKKLAELEEVLSSASEEEASFIADELTAALSAAGADPASPLTVLMQNLAAALRGYSSGSILSVSEAFGTVKTDAFNQTMVQNINKMITQTVISRLCALFGISSDDLTASGADPDLDTSPPAKAPDEEIPPEDDDNDQTIGSGGIGSGDRVYGSNDMIYNPYTNKYVPYGEVFDEYNNRVLQMVEDGRIPPDFEEFTKEYFRSLSDYDPETED